MSIRILSPPVADVVPGPLARGQLDAAALLLLDDVDRPDVDVHAVVAAVVVPPPLREDELTQDVMIVMIVMIVIITIILT